MSNGIQFSKPLAMSEQSASLARAEQTSSLAMGIPSCFTSFGQSASSGASSTPAGCGSSVNCIA